jgi:hypothetical protein
MAAVGLTAVVNSSATITVIKKSTAMPPGDLVGSEPRGPAKIDREGDQAFRSWGW